MPALLRHALIEKALELMEAGFQNVAGKYEDGGKKFRKTQVVVPGPVWWGRGDLNPGPRTPQARILDQTGPRPLRDGLRPSIRGKIINTLFQLKNLGYPESTIKTTSDKLRYLAKYSDLDSPESVKTFIARLKGKNSYKSTLVKAYNNHVKMNRLSWQKPKYTSERKIPRIPATEAINKIIARASQKYALVFKLLAEIGAMPHELHNVTLRDIDLEKGTIAIHGSKRHNSRVFKLKSGTLAMLKTYLRKYDSNQPFPRSEAIGKRWRKFRNIVANNLKEPQLKTIRLYDLRHYFATMLYHKTKDILYVKQQMGHKKLETTCARALLSSLLIMLLLYSFHIERPVSPIKVWIKLIEYGRNISLRSFNESSAIKSLKKEIYQL